MINKKLASLKKDGLYLGVAGIIILSLFGVFFKDHLAPDTMCMYAGGYLSNGSFYLSNGRLIMYIFLYLMDILSIPFVLSKKISWLIGILSLFGGIKVLYFLLKKYSNNNWLNVFTSILVVANIFIVEFFAFPEYTGVMCLGVLFTILSSKNLILYFENGRIKNVAIALLYSILAMFSYQGVMSFVFLIPVLFTMKYSKNIKDFIIRNILVIINYIIPCLLGVVFTKISGSIRVKGVIILKDSLNTIYIQLRNLIARTMEVLPTFLYIFIIILIGITLLILLYREKQKYSKLKIFFLVYVSVLMILVPIAPFIIIPTASIDVCGRSSLALGSIIGFLMIYYIVNVKKSRLFEIGTIIISIIIILISGYNYYQSAIGRFMVNDKDQKEINLIIKEITKYEKEKDIKITKVGYSSDKHKIYNFPNSLKTNIITVRALVYDWSHTAHIEYYLNRDITIIETTEERKKYCLSNNWDQYNKDQLYFEEDRLYVCLY